MRPSVERGGTHRASRGARLKHSPGAPTPLRRARAPEGNRALGWPPPAPLRGAILRESAEFKRLDRGCVVASLARLEFGRLARRGRARPSCASRTGWPPPDPCSRATRAALCARMGD
jgi:hypothetical protein